MNIHIVFLYLLFAMTYLSNVKQKRQHSMCKLHFVCSCLINYNDCSCLYFCIKWIGICPVITFNDYLFAFNVFNNVHH